MATASDACSPCPTARGLFHRAIAQSGAGFNLREVDQALAQTTALMDQLGVTTVEALQAVPVERLVDAQAAFSFTPVQDGVVLADHVIDSVAVGNCADVPLLISHTRDEMRLFAANGRGLGELPTTDDELADRLGRAFADGRRCTAAYRAAEPDASSAELWLSYLTDATFHMPDFGLAEARLIRSPAVWMARFSWPATAMDGQLGACHAIEIPFLFTGGGNLGGMTPEEGPPEQLAHAIQDAWVAFARNGDPNTSALPEWPRYDVEHRLVMELDDECTRRRGSRRRHPPALARDRQRLRGRGTTMRAALLEAANQPFVIDDTVKIDDPGPRLRAGEGVALRHLPLRPHRHAQRDGHADRARPRGRGRGRRGGGGRHASSRPAIPSCSRRSRRAVAATSACAATRACA